jgi:hypothetical protein
MRDLLGKSLAIGDYVFVTRKNYRDFVLARITALTPKNIRVVYAASWSQNALESYLTSQALKVSPNELFTDQKAKADAAFNSFVEQAA